MFKPNVAKHDKNKTASKPNNGEPRGWSVLISLGALLIAGASLAWYIDNNLKQTQTNQDTLAAQNKVRQALDENYFDWESTNLDEYIPHLAQSIGATWPTAYQVWPNVNNYFSGTPILIMYGGDPNVWWVQPDGSYQELIGYASDHNLTVLENGEYFRDDLQDFPNQTVLLKVISYDYFSKVENQNLEWTTAPLPGLMYTQLTETLFNLASEESSTTSTVSAYLNFPVETSAREMRLEILADLRDAYLENDITRRDNYLDRAGYFYKLYKESYPEEAELQNRADVELGSKAYFALQMRLKASFNHYQKDSDLDTFASRVARTDLTTEKYVANLTTFSEPEWLGAMAGLLLDKLESPGWKQETTYNEMAPLALLLNNRGGEQNYEIDIKNNKLMERIEPFWTNENGFISSYQNDFMSGTAYLVIGADLAKEIHLGASYLLDRDEQQLVLTNVSGGSSTQTSSFSLRSAMATAYNSGDLSSLCSNKATNLIFVLPDHAIQQSTSSAKRISFSDDELSVDGMAVTTNTEDKEKSYYCLQ